VEARNWGDGSSPSRIPLIAGILGAIMAILLIGLITLFFIKRRKSERVTYSHDTEMGDWKDSNPSLLETQQFIQFETVLATEEQTVAFENEAFDEAGFGSLLPFGKIFG
jgi:hypothetical protein